MIYPIWLTLGQWKPAVVYGRKHRRADKQNRTTLCMGDYEVWVQGATAYL